jgi:hypothetical protein
MVTAVFEDCIEKQHGITRDLPAERPKLREVRTNGMYLYFLRPVEHSMPGNLSGDGGSASADCNQIASYYVLVHLASGAVGIEGVHT